MRSIWAINLCALVFSMGCGNPSGPTASVVTGQPTAPANGTAISYYALPVKLIVGGATATGGAAPATIVEVATDANFANIVVTQQAIVDASGALVVTLDRLNASTTYYWRAKATVANNQGAYSQVRAFVVGPSLVVQPPAPVSPVVDTFPHKRPTFTITNSVHTGPSATLTYRFDVATDAPFTHIVATGTVPEAATQTTFTPSVDLIPGTTYYWRAQASDATTGVSSNASAAQVFTTVFPEDGSFRYTLAIHAPSYCLTHTTRSDGCGAGSGSGWDVSDYSLDGTLTVTADDFQFSFPNSVSGAPFTFRFTRLKNHLSGALSGEPNYALPNPAPLINAVIFKGDATGDSDNAGRFNGTFDGSVALIREGFPCYHDVTCSTSGFAWTLTPH